MIFVTHDLSVAAQIADKIAVMYAGRIVEFGSASERLAPAASPLHDGSACPRSCAIGRAIRTSTPSPAAA